MATTTQSTVVAVFRNVSDAQAAAADLKSQGFSDDSIYVSRDREGTVDRPDVRDTSTTHHEGGIKGWFKSLFGEEHDPDQHHYETAVASGNILLSVDAADEDVDRAVDILEKHSPIDVHRDESAEANRTAAASAATAPSKLRGREVGENGGSIPVIEEQLKVGKRAVVRGGVRIYSRVVETPVEEQVKLREEKVRVDRQRVDRATGQSDIQPGRDQVIEVKEYAEEPVVSKESRVVEEIRVGKEANERTETIRDTVRHTEVNVENLKGSDATSSTTGTTTANYEDDFRRDFQTKYANTGGRYEDYNPAYLYGYNAANDPRYRDRSFDEVEPELQRDYASRYPNSAWERFKDSVRYGWDKVTGKTRTATTSR